jgi:2-oxoglutarate dehydrogenase E2 component (dihydrolipoamide succinyltransferase)
MALYELLLPKMGESVAEATVIKWQKNVGDKIDIDDSVLEIATDKVDSEVPSPVEGKLVEQRFAEDEVAQVGDVIAIIEIAGEDKVAEKPTAAVEEPVVEEEKIEVPYVPEVAPKTEAKDFAASDRFYSPLVKSIAQEEGISLADLDQIKGSGADGRVTKDDLLNYINDSKVISNATQEPVKEFVEVKKEIVEDKKEIEEDKKETPPIKQEVKATVPQPSSKAAPVYASGGDEIIEMDRMRKLIADHMVNSKHTSAHVTSFVEADVTNMVLWRNKVKSSFEKREGEKITFTPIFIEAVAKAIKDLPMINIQVKGTQIIKKKDINIGMAAALPSGNLIVPVIKNADQLNLVGLTKAVNDLANRSRNNKLQPDEVQGGTFTLTNVGTFGNVMGTPIINQPQVAILAVGAIKKKPAVLETEYGDVIAIRHMMYLSLSYDHRVVDGSLGGMFVRKVADYLEAWDMNREI